MALLSFEKRYCIRRGTLIAGDLFVFWVSSVYVGFFGVTTAFFALVCFLMVTFFALVSEPCQSFIVGQPFDVSKPCQLVQCFVPNEISEKSTKNALSVTTFNSFDAFNRFVPFTVFLPVAATGVGHFEKLMSPTLCVPKTCPFGLQLGFSFSSQQIQVQTRVFI